MSELAFAKQFLTALDSRPARLSSDHVVDPKSYPAQPAFILPRMPHPKRKPSRTTTAGAGAVPGSQPAALPTCTVTLKPTRAALPSFTLPVPVVLSTSIHDLKTAYAQHASLPSATDKIKILYAKKPVGDTKTLKDILPDTAAASSADKLAVEFSVMVMGGGGGPATPVVSTPERVASPPVVVPMDASTPEVEMGEAPVPQGPSGPEVLTTEAFWEDLKGFLVQRLRDEAEAERLSDVFRGAWQKGGS